MKQAKNKDFSIPWIIYWVLTIIYSYYVVCQYVSFYYEGTYYSVICALGTGLCCFLGYNFYLLLRHITLSDGKGIVACSMNTLLIIGGSIMRIYAYGQKGFRLNGIENSCYVNGKIVPTLVHGIEYVYRLIMREGFWLFGNRAFAGFALSFCIQLIALFFISFATLRLIGSCGSVIVTAFFCFSIYWIEGCLFAGEASLIMLLLAVWLWIFSFVRPEKLWCLIPIILAAVFGGISLYLDVFGITILFTGFFFLLGDSTKESKLKKWILSVLFVLLSVGSYIICVYFDSFESGISFSNVLFANWNQYYFADIHSVVIGKDFLAFPEQLFIAGILLIGLMCGFSTKTKAKGCFILPSVLIGMTLFLHFECFSTYSFYSVFSFWLILMCGFVMQSVLGPKKILNTSNEVNSGTDIAALDLFAGLKDGDLAEPEQELVLVDVENINESQDASDEKTTDNACEKSEAEEVNISSKDSELQEVSIDYEKKTVSEAGTPGKVITVDINGDKKQIKLLDNPLKVPEKKQRKPLDFDVEVTDGDDYDI